MKNYGHYCPIARASEILAERWTPIIINSLLHGATTYTQIADNAPESLGVSSQPDCEPSSELV